MHGMWAIVWRDSEASSPLNLARSDDFGRKPVHLDDFLVAVLRWALPSLAFQAGLPSRRLSTCGLSPRVPVKSLAQESLKPRGPCVEGMVEGTPKTAPKVTVLCLTTGTETYPEEKERGCGKSTHPKLACSLEV